MSKNNQTANYFRSLVIRRMFIFLLLLAQIAFLILTIAFYSKLRWVEILFRLLALVTALHLFTHEQPAAFKLSLIFLLLLIPLFGGVFYWIFHYQTTTVGFRKRLRKIELSTAQAFLLPGEATKETEATLPDAQRLIRYLNTAPGFPIYRNTESEYYGDGKAFQASLLKELKNAKRYIFLEFFIIGEGSFWDSILAVLEERARAGVDVRVIYDDLGSFLTLPHKYARELRKKGIRCEVFNPFRPFLTSIQNNRDHRKIAVVDGRVAFTGGMNLADEYINEKERFGHWKDAAICFRGDAAWSFTVMFLQMWSFLTHKNEDCTAYLPSAFPPRPELAGRVQPYTDSPMDVENVGEQVYLQIIGAARHYLYLTTPYLLPDSSMLQALVLAAKSGVDVRIITPHRPDKRLVHFTTRSYYRELVRAGVKIYEYSDGFIHSKNMIADDHIASVGTVNLDFRSLYLHFECGACLYSDPAILEIKRDFLATLQRSHLITPAECRATPIKALLQDICRLLSPLM